MKTVLETEKLEVTIEDCGHAMIAEVGEAVQPDPVSDLVYGPDPLFVRIHSWDDSLNHSEMKQLIGKRIRVTIDVIE